MDSILANMCSLTSHIQENFALAHIGYVVPSDKNRQASNIITKRVSKIDRCDSNNKEVCKQDKL